MTLKAPPPSRIQIDFRTVMAIMVFFGVGTWGTMLLAARKGVWWLVEPAVKCKLDEMIPLERTRNDAMIKAAMDSLSHRNDLYFRRIENLLLEMPGGKTAAKKIQEREARQQTMFGATTPPQDIIIF